MMTASKRYGIGAVFVVGVAALTWWQMPAQKVSVSPAPEVNEASIAAQSPVTIPDLKMTNPSALDVQFTTGLEALPSSLGGTEVDGSFEVDANGHLVVSKDIRHIFDYFLSTLGEESLDVIAARIRAYINDNLQDPAAAEALVIFYGYLELRHALADLTPAVQKKGINTYAMRGQMDQVAALRSQYLAMDVVDAFYADEDAYNRYSLARLDIMQDESLTPEQRNSRLSALEQQLPQELRQSMSVPAKYHELQAAVSACKEADCSSQELREVRERVVGVEAADRLEALDQEEAAWSQRLESWYQIRDRLINNESLSEGDRHAEVDRLRETLFRGGELVRVKSLERLHDNGVELP